MLCLMLNLASVVAGGKLVNNVVKTPQIWFYEEIWFYGGYAARLQICVQFGYNLAAVALAKNW